MKKSKPLKVKRNKPKEYRPIPILVNLDVRTLDLVKRLSQSFGITRSRAIRYAIKYAYYTSQFYSKYVIETGKPPSRYLQKKYNLTENNLLPNESIVPKWRVKIK
jgi:hypothetical protein